MNSRELFQKWWEDFYETTPLEPWDEIYSPEHDYFVDQDIDGQYDAWKASRAAIEIDIDWPEANDDFWKDGEDGAYASGHTDGRQQTTDAVVRAIRAAGLTVKGGSK
ncbi:hypothetical protein [Atlantibacter hermannii]|uniref:hypothetical protein n=1 Tax=Atlantibacter hermannii TaxID=565 RepID=UPI00289E94E6|nr:hypothetical protein [Atlantibacter hermannii]